MQLHGLLLAGIAVLALAGCASEQLASYVGKPVTEPILDYGPPTSVLELGENRRAYQWARVNSGVVPITSPSYSTVYGPGGVATVNTTTTSYIPYSENCVYTLTATRSGDAWIVDGYRKPTLACE